MKKILIISTLIFFLFSSCTSTKLIGKLNMVSNRNINTELNYELISTYAGASKKEIRNTKSRQIEDAVDQTVRKIPGGEFLTNVKIYEVRRGGIIFRKSYIAVEGDVWGKKTDSSYRGFKQGDIVTWKNINTYEEGTIRTLKDDKTCLIENKKGDIIEKKYDDIIKMKH